MTTTANPGAELPIGAAGGRTIAESDDAFSEFAGYDRDRGSSSDHDPEAKALLRRYLSEVHSFREMGNNALRNLEARLAHLPPDFALPADDEAEDIDDAPVGRAGPGSHLMRPSLTAGQQAEAPVDPQPRRDDPALHQRLHELSAYLHADLSREQPDSAPAAGFGFAAGPIPAADPRPQPRRWAEPASGAPHKIPTLPVLDRAWFEERFAMMRTSMDRLTEQLPLNRLEALESQFRDLMDRLGQRETARDPRPLDASLKELAAYLADSRQWAVANEKRVKGLEDKLERLGKLVAQSHAAISATAKGLELVAKGTGETLARKTADIVVAQIGKSIDGINPAERIDQLGREVAHLTAQSRHLARSTEDRLEQIQIVLKEKDRAGPVHGIPPGVRIAGPPGTRPQASKANSHDELESYLNNPVDDREEDYDSEMIAAAEHAAKLADGPAQRETSRSSPVRYQIPYGEFLPDENSPPSRVALIVAIVILALAGATMLFLKWKEWTLIQHKPAASVETPQMPVPAVALKQARSPAAAEPPSRIVARSSGGSAMSLENVIGTPVVTGSTPAAPPLAAKPMQLWVASNAAEQDRAALQPKPSAEAESTDASFREAAVKGDLNAQFSVGQSYLSGQDDAGNATAPDPAAGVRWIRRSAERGYAPAQYKLATLYEIGHAIPRDITEAQGWYEKAALQGHVKAMHNLAVLAASAKGKPANYAKAARWFKEAAAYGLVDSEFNLGILYERGLGVTRDMIEAYRWFSLAARQGDAKARQRRDEVAKLLAPADRLNADRLIAGWTPKQRSAEVNRIAPEMPVSNAPKPDAPRVAETTSAAVVKAAWKPDAAVSKPVPGSALVMEAQRLLRQRGYDPGPADGVPGPRTVSAIRSFQRSAGLPATGEVNSALIVKMAFLPL